MLDCNLHEIVVATNAVHNKVESKDQSGRLGHQSRGVNASRPDEVVALIMLKSIVLLDARTRPKLSPWRYKMHIDIVMWSRRTPQALSSSTHSSSQLP